MTATQSSLPSSRMLCAIVPASDSSVSSSAGGCGFRYDAYQAAAGQLSSSVSRTDALTAGALRYSAIGILRTSVILRPALSRGENNLASNPQIPARMAKQE